MELNDEIREKISSAASVDEVVRICAEAGIPVTKEQLEASDTTGAEGELSEPRARRCWDWRGCCTADAEITAARSTAPAVAASARGKLREGKAAVNDTLSFFAV